MDVGMPRLNGYEATRRIREQPWGRSVLIIALTGWGQEGDKERSREAGCDGHLVKPVSLPDLEQLLAELSGAGGLRGPPRARTESTWASREKARSGSPIRGDVHEGWALLRVAHVNEPRGTIHRSQGMDRAAGRRLGAAWTTQRASMRGSINLSDLPSPLLRAVRGRQRLPRRVGDDEPRNAPSRLRYVASTSVPWSIRSVSIFPSS